MRSRLWIIMASMAISLILFNSVSRAAITQSESNLSSLTLQIGIPKTEFMPLEPIPITITLKNATNEPILEHTSISFSSGDVELFIGDNASKMHPFNGDISRLKKYGQYNQQMIKPGVQIQLEQLLDINLDKNCFQPGNYQIYLILHDLTTQQKIQSNTLTIQILEPTGLDLQALDYLRRNGDISSFFSGFTMLGNEAQQNVLQTFTANFRATNYGNYAAFLLGNYYLSKGEYERAIEQLDSLAGNTAFIHNDNVLLHLVEANIKLRKVEQAKSYLQILKDKHPTSHHIPEAAMFVYQADRNSK
jgi:hypothetical protein